MSRSVSVAYDLPAVKGPPARSPKDSWPGRGDSSVYRLLGDDELFGGPRPLLLDQVPALPIETPGGYLDREVEMPGAYFAALEDERKLQPLQPSLARLAIGLAVAILLAIGLLLITPVLANGANGRFGGAGTSLSISRYADLASGASASTIAPPDIDATSGVAAAPQAAQVQPQPAPSQPGRYDLVAAPSISVRQIEAVLTQYGSPAAGQGQALYDLGVKYGIDPSYALAFFVHESACGTRGVARFTHSLGNIRWTDGYDNYEGYRSYGSWQEGMEDWYKLITDLYINAWGLRTVDQIIPVYAPAADSNNPPTYIASVKFLVDSWRGK